MVILHERKNTHTITQTSKEHMCSMVWKKHAYFYCAVDVRIPTRLQADDL